MLARYHVLQGVLAGGLLLVDPPKRLRENTYGKPPSNALRPNHRTHRRARVRSRSYGQSQCFRSLRTALKSWPGACSVKEPSRLPELSDQSKTSLGFLVLVFFLTCARVTPSRPNWTQKEARVVQRLEARDTQCGRDTAAGVVQ